MRTGIFIKVFLGFWLVTITIVSSWIVMENYIEELPRDHRPPHGRDEGPPQRFILHLIYRLQTVSDESLPEVVDKVKQEHDITVYLLDRKGSEILGRSPPSSAIALAETLEGRKRRAFHRGKGQPMTAHEIYRSEQGVVRAVLVFPERKHKLLGFLINNHWMRLALALLVSGLVCYGLSLLMTRRLKQLQQAAGRIASGDLSARLKVRDKGGDETDELARDFNSMASQLEARVEAQRRLLSDVSHELRSPLARMRVAIALAQDAPEKSPDTLDRMEREAERLEALIQQLLSSQQEHPNLDKHIDLVALLRELVADATFEGEQSGKSVLLHTEVEQALVASSEDLLHKCFDNIIRNALRHTPGNSQVNVRLELEGTHYRVAITDQGGGLPEQELERIFDAFYRVDSARSRQDGGHGLGLAIAKRAALVHGGSIDAANSDNGLEVVVRLPHQE